MDTVFACIWLGGLAYGFSHAVWGPWPHLVFQDANFVWVWLGVDLLFIGAVFVCAFGALYWSRHTGHIEINSNGIAFVVRHAKWPIGVEHEIRWCDLKNVVETKNGLRIMGPNTRFIVGLGKTEQKWLGDWSTAHQSLDLGHPTRTFTMLFLKPTSPTKRTTQRCMG